ncbi:DnaD and phage-associated domain-containing protein [Lentibacillus persicus]|uniref:DnaD and phage-associated domain-containing protein n=1 Tax=Lentibacillus persicus TaxID=640948 RepID=A0A1I1W2A8_9BACI|nr:DnaD domain protein [Lentibacillus persicus]SFD87433.1 DnaD and phage-associated domain-containing protein [Lentibacillus persicus]
MNYIKEINAFYDSVDRNQLSGSAVALWHALIHINNKARWIDTFTVAAPVLRLKSGLPSSSFKRARKELQDKGYIRCTSRGNGLAPEYRMVKLDSGIGVERVEQDGPRLPDQDDGHAADLPDSHDAGRGVDHPQSHLTDQDADHVTAPLVKQKKNNTKPKNSDHTANQKAHDDVFVFYQNNFGRVSPYVTDALLNWVRDVGEALVLDAMKRAIERGKTNWGYVKAILQDWAAKGITTVEAAKAEEEAFRQSRQQRRGWQRPSGEGASGSGASGHGAGSREVIPEWFKEQKRKEKQTREKKKAQSRTRDPEAEQELQQLLASFRSG